MCTGRTFAGGFWGWAAQEGSGAVNCTGVESRSGGGRVATQKSNRYHREGGLELSLLALDFLAHSGQEAYFAAVLLPQIVECEYHGWHDMLSDPCPCFGHISDLSLNFLQTSSTTQATWYGPTPVL
eukprot:SAG11_NODE_683_length_7747_cov_3.047463_4_plen_126_part_00